MKDSSRSRRINDWASQQLQGPAARPPAWGSDRRERKDRRIRAFWSILYGSFNPRRRRPARRLNDSRFHPIDWYSAHLLAVSIGILLFSAADAFLTGILLLHGADEINPIMAVLVYRSVAAFAAFKMAMTGLISLAPCISRMDVRNASAALNNKMPMDTASRRAEYQSIG